MKPYRIGLKRGKLERMLDLLDAAADPAPPTVVMYRANLSWAPFRLLVDELVDKGLLEEVEPADAGRWRPPIGAHGPKTRRPIRVLLVTTRKGQELLEATRGLRETR